MWDDREVLGGLIQAVPAHKILFDRFTGIADTSGCESAFPPRWIGIDRLSSVRVDAESDSGCAGRGAPTAGSPHDRPSYVERTTRPFGHPSPW